MILQSLKEYYDRKTAMADATIAPLGWENKELPFLIVLKPDGSPVSIEDTRELVGKKLRARTFLVPQAVKRTVGKKANLLWDDPEYALAMDVKGDPENAKEKHHLFIRRISDEDLSDITDVTAVLKFLNRQDKLDALASLGPERYEELKNASFISFKIAGHTEPVFRNSAVVERVSSAANTIGLIKSLCLVSGNTDVIDPTHPSIKGVRDANTTGGNIVSFNASAFCSFGKEQGANAPIGKTASFSYTTALNTLLGKDSVQKIQVGDATTVFWAAKDDGFETEMSAFFGEPPKDDPERLVNAVRSLYRSADTGAFITEADTTRFYVLGISPNAARLAIRFWRNGTVAELAARFRQHFDDLKINHGPRDQDQLPIWRYLVSTAAQGKSENIPPNLAGDTMRSILEGIPYPQTLLQAAVRRTRAERDITYARAALMKACLNRSLRFNNPTNERELNVSLDTANTNIGYRLGRLFAVLERVQERASPGINATIRDRFYGAASGTPVTVFGNLMRLKNHHLSKLENNGERVNYEKLFGEVMSGINDFPAHLPLADQGRFAIGYYHQKQDFFTKKTDNA